MGIFGADTCAALFEHPADDAESAQDQRVAAGLPGGRAGGCQSQDQGDQQRQPQPAEQGALTIAEPGQERTVLFLVDTDTVFRGGGQADFAAAIDTVAQ